MKNILRKSSAVPFSGLLSGVAVIVMGLMSLSCSDWTDTESLKIKEQEQSKNYEKYLAELRAYKNSDHNILYTWFDNQETAPSMGNTLTALPDSVDIVNLMNPKDLPSWIQDQMKEIREQKGTKTVYTIDFPGLETDYKMYLAGLEEEVEPIPFLTYMATYLDEMIPLCEKYGFDGISVYYNGAITDHMTPDEIEDYEAKQTALMSRISSWYSSNSGKILIFEGGPQNLMDKSILDKVEFIVLRTENLTSGYALTIAALDAIEKGGVPTDRIVVSVQTAAIDPADLRYGYFYDSQSETGQSRAIPLAAQWVKSPDSRFTKKGLGIYNVQNDYYSSSNSYQYTREAAFILNPSAKY